MSEIVLPGKISDFMKIGVAAAGRGDVKAVGDILEQRPEWITRGGAHGRTMLWEAARRGKIEMVKYLAERGADIDDRGTHYTPYFVEVTCGFVYFLDMAILEPRRIERLVELALRHHGLAKTLASGECVRFRHGTQVRKRLN